MSVEMMVLKVSGMNIPVTQTGGNIADGIAFGEHEGAVFVTISKNGTAFYVRLHGDTLDCIAGMFGDAIAAATRWEHPSLGAMQ